MFVCFLYGPQVFHITFAHHFVSNILLLYFVTTGYAGYYGTI